MTDDPWQGLRQFTRARIALGRAGASLPTSATLAFQLDHARARDAVHQCLDEAALVSGLIDLFGSASVVRSQAASRAEYLQRPDLGRQLKEADWQHLADQHRSDVAAAEVVPIVTDGLSATAINRHTLPFLAAWQAEMAEANVLVAPPLLVHQGRVAIGDDIGEALGAKMTLLLVGERPGLSSPDSLGLYLTYRPRRGGSDAQRNCISNVRPEGLSYERAAQTCRYLILQALSKGLSGVGLKDDSQQLEADSESAIPFLR